MLTDIKNVCQESIAPKDTLKTTLCDDDTQVDREQKFYNAGWKRGIKAAVNTILKTMEE